MDNKFIKVMQNSVIVLRNFGFYSKWEYYLLESLLNIIETDKNKAKYNQIQSNNDTNACLRLIKNYGYAYYP